MRGKFVHRIGAIILALVMFSGIPMLGATTAQAHRTRVVVVPRVYIGPGPYHRHWHHHRRYGW
jgi:hypothetical protein